MMMMIDGYIIDDDYDDYDDKIILKTFLQIKCIFVFKIHFSFWLNQLNQKMNEIESFLSVCLVGLVWFGFVDCR